MQCAAELAREVEVLIVAGGDGSFSDAINALDSETIFSYLPFGSGCALRYALDLPPQLTRVAKRIKEGRLRLYDLILCDGVRKGFMTSVGLEADILHRREALRDSGITGPAGLRHGRVRLVLHRAGADRHVHPDRRRGALPCPTPSRRL